MLTLILMAQVAATPPPYARCLLEAYPDQLCGATATHLVWCDGEQMPWKSRDPKLTAFADKLGVADLHDQMSQRYPVGAAWVPPPAQDHDPGRLRYEPFFKKMYGGSAREVGETIARVRWLGGQELPVTRINGVNTHIESISEALARLDPSHRRIVDVSAGAFVWRTIKGTQRLSMHSFAIAIDVGVKHAHYWKWSRPGPDGRRRWQNKIPMEVVARFEEHGFIWGGKWDHFDTMHFEYRPELLHPACVAR